MKVLEKEIDICNGGCTQSSIAIEYKDYIYIALYENAYEEYYVYRGKKDIVNKLYNTDNVLAHFGIDDVMYYDLLSDDNILEENFEFLGGNCEKIYDESNKALIEEFLMKKIKKFIKDDKKENKEMRIEKTDIVAFENNGEAYASVQAQLNKVMDYYFSLTELDKSEEAHKYLDKQYVTLGVNGNNYNFAMDADLYNAFDELLKYMVEMN